jgi:hypothetical protein
MARKWTATTDESFARQNEVAVREAREAERIEPRATFVSYDAARGLVLVEMASGFVFGFAPERAPGLAGASAEQLSAVRISPSGDGLHWGDLDAHVSLGGLITEALNLREWAPRIMGRIKTEAKAKAARENGAKGGRPRKRAAALKTVSRRAGAKG